MMKGQPMMQQNGMPGKGAPQQQPRQQMAGQQMPRPNEPLGAHVLAAAPPHMQKQMLGERLYPAVGKFRDGGKCDK